MGGLISRFFSTPRSFFRSLSLLSAQTGCDRIIPVIYFQHSHLFPLLSAFFPRTAGWYRVTPCLHTALICSIMLPTIAKTPRSTMGKGQPQQSQLMLPPERPVEHVDDWTPHDVAEWLYTRVRSGPQPPHLRRLSVAHAPGPRHRAPRTTTRTPLSSRASTGPRL